MNYEADIRIDDGALDLEWLEQPSLMMKYTRLLADAEKELDLAKEELDLVKSDIDKDIRLNPDKYDLSKVTDAAVLAAISTQTGFKRVSKRVVDARYEVNVLKGAVKAFEQRKDALENLGRLLALNYFAGPKIPRDLSNEKKLKEDRITRQNEGIRKSLRRK